MVWLGFIIQQESIYSPLKTTVEISEACNITKLRVFVPSNIPRAHKRDI